MRENERTPELPAAQYPPVFVHPTGAFPEILGDLLDSQDSAVWRVVKVSRDAHDCSIPGGTQSPPGNAGATSSMVWYFVSTRV